MTTVAIYLGGEAHTSIVRYLSGVSWVRPDGITFVLVGDDLDVGDLTDQYNSYDVARSPGTRGADSFRLAYRDLCRYLGEDVETPDALWQVKSPEIHALPLIAAGRQFGVPTITRITNQNFSEWRERPGIGATVRSLLLNNVGLRGLRFSDRVQVLSENNRQNLTDRGVPPEKITVLRSPLNTDQFAPVSDERKRELRRELGFDETATCVVYVGRLIDIKGMDTLLDAASRLPELNFHVVGDGPFRAQFEEHENTVAHGLVHPDDVHRYYKAADLLLHPSYTEEDGISWSMIEAAATRLPVVTRDIENAAETASFVFSELDELCRYLEQPEQWRPATYPEKWSIDSLRGDYQSFFRAVVESPSAVRQS
ncbi:glycosyltransferase family 4 protein [Haloarcula halophila]|uniref:glycosyltransferase family 4 protein n=1 Tax=Haloarcula TaxID=2237 RepID=UPI0023E3E9D9|nr:glycosyltransferase family 4 protein [Halomicroarcula sp. DFY41]